MRTSHSNKKLVVISSGDPAGIGPEIIIKSLAESSIFRRITPLVIGDCKVFRKTTRIINTSFDLITSKSATGACVKENTVNFIDIDNVSFKKFRFGATDKDYGKAAMEYLSLGVDIVAKNKGSSLVTAPISKESINMAGYKYKGHTEYLADRTGSKNVTMMLIGGGLRVSLVTRHIQLKDVAKSINTRIIASTIENTYYALKNIFKIKFPTVGVAALNPHAGEGGLLGNEEKDIILPAIKSFKRSLIGLSGPYPSDTLFYKAYKGDFDAVVCMYHDQGLIPLKMIAFETGVNLTIGLPFVRTSPDHGTAFDIAGKGIANPASMIQAIKLAAGIN